MTCIFGGEVIADALLAHPAPVGWQHINLTGDYLWDSDIGLGPDGFRFAHTSNPTPKCLIRTLVIAPPAECGTRP